MFGKLVVIVVLATLVNNSSLQPMEDDFWSDRAWNENSVLTVTKPTMGMAIHQREIKQYLNCANLKSLVLNKGVIHLSNTIFLKADNPCNIKSSIIIIENCEFPGQEHAYNITGNRIIMINNKFDGSEQNHYIVGDNVLLLNNTYRGDLQIHEIAGYDVSAFTNVYDGKYRLVQYSGTTVLVFDNKDKKFPFEFRPQKYRVEEMYNLYPKDLSYYYPEHYFCVDDKMELYTNPFDYQSFDLTPINTSHFLQDVKVGSKINRPANADIIKKFENLCENHLKFMNNL